MQLSGLFWKESNKLLKLVLNIFMIFILRLLSWTVHSMICALVEDQEYILAFRRILLAVSSLENVITNIEQYIS